MAPLEAVGASAVLDTTLAPLPAALVTVVLVLATLVVTGAFPIELTAEHELLFGAGWAGGVAGSP